METFSPTLPVVSKPLARLWPRWVLANSLGELLGLGGTFALMALLIPLVSNPGAEGVWLGFALAVGCGLLEATLVAGAQRWAFRPWLGQITWRAWWAATAVGALLAYVLGYLPSTLMSLASNNQAAVAEPAQWVTWLLAAGLGVVGGAVLSFMQWRVLRQAGLAKAGLWIPANMLAWAAGMPLIFMGMDLAFAQNSLVTTVLIIAIALALAGAAVGAIHGRFLVLIVGKT